ncbi:MAG: glycosyltransferase family 4 protein [Crocinitomicaceae bacterium]
MFSKNMGYGNVCFPKSISKIKGAEAHVLTSQAQYNYNHPEYEQLYQKFHGDPILPVGTEELAPDFYVHRIPFKLYKTEIYFVGLYKAIKKIRPDYVQVFDCNSIDTFKLALFKPFLGYKLYTGNSTVLSVFPMDRQWKTASWFTKLKWQIKHVFTGRIISWMSNRCYPSTIDASYIAENYFGIQKHKLEVSPLGYDAELFAPDHDLTKKKDFKKKLGFTEHDFICIYTGRMMKDKNPLLLAQAIDWINQNTDHKVQGVFIGEGEQKEAIKNTKNVLVLDFMSHTELPAYYQFLDVGVWPTQESTSMIDAAACGLPIIVSDQLKAIERVEGNGLQYKEGDFVDLAKKIIQLKENSDLYKQLSEYGAQKMRSTFSWDAIANYKLSEYQKF